MSVIQTQNNLPWLPQPNTVVITATDELPPLALCTAAYVLAFEGDDVLMARLDRGVDIPGGHIDPGETPEQAMRREVREETGASLGPARLFAVQKMTVTGPKPEGYTYPYPVSYQLMYVAQGVTQGAFTSDEDSIGPVMVTRTQAGDVPWLQNNRALYDYAFSIKDAAAVSRRTGFSPPSQ